MKFIVKPPDASFTILCKDGPVEKPLVFSKILIELLDNAPQFGTRAGARRAVFIEKAINESGDYIRFEDEDHALVLAAVNGFSWIPQAAKIMERAGWFEAIEKATAEKPEPKVKIVTNQEVQDA